MNADREAFERWADTIGAPLECWKSGPAKGEYESVSTERAWLAWQARVPADHVVVPREPSDEMLNSGGAATRRSYCEAWLKDKRPNEVMCSYIYRAMIAASAGE